MCIPKVSVIIPVYNTEKYVRQAVESIRRQTLKDIEIIIVNDGSTDGSMTILEELAAQDERIKLFSQENQGQGTARNTGLHHAIGEYIYFMDSDDLLESDTFELCFQKCKDENLDFVFFNAESFSENEQFSLNNFNYIRTTNLAPIVYKGDEILIIQLNNNDFKAPVWLNFINRKFITENVLYFHPKMEHEDQLFTAQAYLHAKRVSFLHNTFFKRRVRGNSTMTRKFAWKNMHGYLNVTAELLKYASKHPEHKKLIDLFLSQMLDAAVWQAHVLPISKRIKLLSTCVAKYNKYVTKRTLLTLLFKSVITPTIHSQPK